MMPTFPSPSLKFRTAGFPRYGFKAGVSDRAFPFDAWPSRRRFASVLRARRLPRDNPRTVPGNVARLSTTVRAALAALPQGPSLRSGLCCPSPSSLNRPHPPHSRAHRDFASGRLIRDALAVLSSATHEWFRAFTARSFSTCRPLRPRGIRSTTYAHLRRRRHWPSRFQDALGIPKSPTIRFRWATDFGASPVHSFAAACRVASLLDGSDRVSPAAETFTPGLSTLWSPVTPPGMTTVALGQSPLAGLSPAGTAASIAAP